MTAFFTEEELSGLGLNIVDPMAEMVRQNKEAQETEQQKSAEELSSRIKETSELLAKVSPAKNIPLNVFHRIFFPIFSGEINAENDKDEFIKRTDAWINAAGGTYTEVPIVHHVTGKFLFHVPPLMNVDILTTKTIQLSNENTPSIGLVHSHAEGMRANGHTQRATSIEEEHLEKRLPNKEDSISQHLIYAVRWNDICEYLNEPPIFKEVYDAMASVNTNGNNLEASSKNTSVDSSESTEKTGIPDVDDFF